MMESTVFREEQLGRCDRDLLEAVRVVIREAEGRGQKRLSKRLLKAVLDLFKDQSWKSDRFQRPRFKVMS